MSFCGHLNCCILGIPSKYWKITMPTRRGFIQTISITGVSLLAACSEKVAPPAQAPSSPPAKAETPPPAPIAQDAPSASVPSPATPSGPASNFPMLNPAEPAAVALGYVEDAARANASKYPNYLAGQACANCALFAGRPGDASGPCPLFPGRQVSVRGWCSGYNKKTT